MVYPTLRGCTAEELQALADGTIERLDTAEPLRFPDGGAIVFEGCEIPHYRAPGAPGSGFVGVAQLCYRPIWAKSLIPRRMVADRPLTPMSPERDPR
jgi:hypothetical protein